MAQGPRTPLSPAGQLGVLLAAVATARSALSARVVGAAGAMRTDDGDDGPRHLAVAGVRDRVRTIRRDVLPLMDRVPAAYRSHPRYVELRRRSHALRRDADAAWDAVLSWQLDLHDQVARPANMRSIG